MQQVISIERISIKISLFLFLFFSFPVQQQAQTLPEETKSSIEKYLTELIRQQTSVRSITIDSVAIEKKKIKLFVSENLSYGRFDKVMTDTVYSRIKSLFPSEWQRMTVELYSDGYKIEDYIPLYRKERFTNQVNTPVKKNNSIPYKITKGLQNKHIALGPSHGWYYNSSKNRWEWQRARLFQTVEDVFTQSFVLPYLAPMLENAGATVFIPRERDTQTHEIIVDNDENVSQGKSEYFETAGDEQWISGEYAGFAHLKAVYQDGENPFKDGTYRQIQTVKKGKTSACTWLPDIPEKGKYGVYIAYISLENSTKDALYTVYHTGGKTEFSINQTMGGGTWIFLGFFDFDKGVNEQCKIVLSNISKEKEKILTADAVKIGGGIGNIARGEPLEPSGRPRYIEGSRYWLQWAGLPDSIYSWTKGEKDYIDDYQSRGLWVNHLIGSQVPIDAVLSFHTDAGTTYNDSIIGTLGICMTHYKDEKFDDGKPRILSRDLVSTVMDEMIRDIRLQFDPAWTRRHIWNRSYSEARLPEAPTMLLELLSHQNFADMRYGLDPEFRFTVSRAIYKGFLKFIAYQYQSDYVIAPLPVKSFSAQFADETHVKLEWQATVDSLEPSAFPTKYVVYTAVDDNGFDNGQIVSQKQAIAVLPVEKDRIYRFRITAVNEGGESFPSETLSVCRKTNEKGVVLVVNGFTRLSAPDSFVAEDSIAGFLDFLDHGVPEAIQTNYIGSQYEFRRQIPWTDNDANGFGASNANYEATIVAGNTFNYPYIHGKSIVAAGYSFVSASSEAVMNNQVTMNDYPVTDIILGNQRLTSIGRGAFPSRFKTFPDSLQSLITTYCHAGGNIFVSGSYIGSDLWDNGQVKEADKQFAQNTLKYKWRTGHAAVTGKVKSVFSPFLQLTGDYQFYNQLNPIMYAVDSPDAIEPADENSHTILRYSENNISAGVAYSGNYKTCVLGFPFETISDETLRNQFMQGLLEFMLK
jgi:N-acetylmuramoyl-L-alanine amidase